MYSISSGTASLKLSIWLTSVEYGPNWQSYLFYLVRSSISRQFKKTAAIFYFYVSLPYKTLLICSCSISKFPCLYFSCLIKKLPLTHPKIEDL